MRGASLFNRIRRPELAIARRKISDSEIRESLLEHLRHMCSTRQGTMLTNPDYGIPDVGETCHSFPDAIDNLGRALRQTIQRYEPRLTDVRVAHVPDTTKSDVMILRYHITGRIVIEGEERAIAFETHVDQGRRIVVE
jgi:type VI secretion system protein